MNLAQIFELAVDLNIIQKNEKQLKAIRPNPAAHLCIMLWRSASTVSGVAHGHIDRLSWWPATMRQLGARARDCADGAGAVVSGSRCSGPVLVQW
jgi:hypothetical protein